MALKKYKILDLSTLLPGPFSSYIFSQFNFDITKIEDIRNNDPLRQMWPTKGGVSVVYKTINQNKNIIELDFRQDKDISKLNDLIAKSDVLIENFISGRLDKFGFSFKNCQKLNPNIIYCSITGFGYKHPLTKKPAHDLNILGLSGYLNLNKNFQIPPLPIADIITSYEVTIQILAALLRGKSVWLDVSMLDSMTKASLITNSIEKHLGRHLKSYEYPLWGNHPCYNLYKTSDDKYMALAAIEHSLWVDFCNNLGIPEIIDQQFDTDPKVKTRVQNVVSTKTQDGWVKEDLNCFTPVLSYLESKKHGYV